MNQAMNPHLAKSTSLFSLVQSLIQNRGLILRMSYREISSRYKGSVLGLAWSLFIPIFMLSVYTIVFSEIFKSRWVTADTQLEPNKFQFALLLFIGLIVINLFNEVVNRSPGLIVGHVNYVKKVIFPIEILPVITLVTSLFNSAVSFVVLCLAMIILNGSLPWTIVFIPIVVFPFLLFILGISWFLASLGVFIRDIAQAIGLVTTVVMFMSPVFYPVSAVPEKWRMLIMINPPTFIIEQCRQVLIFGYWPDWSGLGLYLILSFFVFILGYVWFQKTRKGFADVL